MIMKVILIAAFMLFALRVFAGVVAEITAKKIENVMYTATLRALLDYTESLRELLGELDTEKGKDNGKESK